MNRAFGACVEKVMSACVEANTDPDRREFDMA
ncbi:MAG: hypothetical protein ACI9BO_001419 [Zhongshania sp.]|jgi:hypothetical protein